MRFNNEWYQHFCIIILGCYHVFSNHCENIVSLEMSLKTGLSDLTFQFLGKSFIKLSYIHLCEFKIRLRQFKHYFKNERENMFFLTFENTYKHLMNIENTL